jgi:hypothetical protein
MMRLIKFAIYALAGYVLYEFITGITQGTMEMSGPSEDRAGERAGRDNGRPARRIVETQDSDGGAARHTVGRGVVHR